MTGFLTSLNRAMPQASNPGMGPAPGVSELPSRLRRRPEIPYRRSSSETNLRRPGIGQSRVLEVVNVIAGEFECRSTGRTSASRCARSTRPRARACVRSWRTHRRCSITAFDHFGPARRIVGQERNRQLGELRRAARVAHLAADPDGKPSFSASFIGMAGQTV